MISSIELRNFKTFISQEVGLNYLTIFTGLNGMGKSSFIQSLLLLRQSELQGKLNEKGGLALNGELTTIGVGKDVFAVEAYNDIISINIKFKQNNYIKCTFAYDPVSDIQNMLSYEISGNKDEMCVFNNNFQYLHAERLSPERDLFPASTSNVKNGILGKNGQYTVHYIAENQRKPISIKPLKHDNSKTDILLENIECWLSEISPGVRITATFFPELNSSKLSYKFTVGDETSSEFKPSNVGFGITYVLPVITAILISEPGDLIIIENPESHVHPNGQAALAVLFCIAAQHGVQLIIETHSDHIINGTLISINSRINNSKKGLDSKKVYIYFIEREENIYKSKLNSIEISESGRISNPPNNFFDRFSKDLRQILGVK